MDYGRIHVLRYSQGESDLALYSATKGSNTGIGISVSSTFTATRF